MMIQIIDEHRKPTGLERFMQMISGGLQGAVEGGQALKGSLDERSTREALSKEFGQQFKDIRNPEFQKIMLQEELSKRKTNEKNAQDLNLEKQDYDWIKDNFGEGIANFWRSNTTGGRTKITEALINQSLRHLSPEEIIGGATADEEEDLFTQPDKKTSPLTPKEPKVIKNDQGQEFHLPDHSKRTPGYTQVDWNKKREGWEDRNFDIFEENRKHLLDLDRDMLETQQLTNLNETRKLPEDFDKLLINPSTGEPYGIAQLAEIVSPEAQQWVKVVNRFGNRAKNAFGSRVTNFDLQQYMKQFPSLMNSYEGRKRILRMMDINYQLDHLYNKAVQQIYDSTELDNISPNEVDRLSRQMISEQTQKLKDEYLNLDRENENLVSTQGQKREKKSLEGIFG